MFIEINVSVDHVETHPVHECRRKQFINKASMLIMSRSIIKALFTIYWDLNLNFFKTE